MAAHSKLAADDLPVDGVPRVGEKKASLPSASPSEKKWSESLRLSFTIWCMIRAENHDLQKVLETQSTSDRLRLAVLRLREMREQARGQMPK